MVDFHEMKPEIYDFRPDTEIDDKLFGSMEEFYEYCIDNPSHL